MQQQASHGDGPTSAYEDTTTRATQWWADGGLYFGYSAATPAEVAHPLRSTWDPLGGVKKYRQDRHVVTVGPNGSGKTRRLLLPNLYHLKNWSIVAIDPKGELFAHTAFERAKTPGHKIMLLDPFGVVKSTYPHLAKRFPCESHGFNPVSSLDPESSRFVDHAKALAVALIKSEGERDKYWSQAAQALFKGVLLAARLQFGDMASLGLIRQMLGASPETLADDLGKLVNAYGKKCPEVTASLSEFVKYNPEDRELGGIRRSAKVQTDWLGSQEMAADLEKGSFDFGSLKETPTTIYLVLPPEYLASHGTWLRLMVTAILRPLLRAVSAGAGQPPAVPVLFMLDEFAALGHMEIIKDNYALMRGYGVKLWTVWQDLNQAKILYDDWWESFISNAGMVQAFAPGDMTTRNYLSELADKRLSWVTTESKSQSSGWGQGFNMSSGSSTSQAHLTEPIMYPYELAQMKQGQSVLFSQGGSSGGEVWRSYFPDATKLPGVSAMMAEAERNLRP